MNNPTLLMCLSAHLQSWGGPASWEKRSTLRRPTKSGVIGLIANAQGRDYRDNVDDLAALTFTARLDRPGTLLDDTQTAGGGPFPLLPIDYLENPELADEPKKFSYGAPRAPELTPDGRLAAAWTGSARATVVVEKTYLCDAAFLVGLTGAPQVIDAAARALENPQRTLYLGRKSCLPDGNLLHGITTKPRWYDTIPLIERATTTTPEVWRQTSPGPNAIGFPEQPGPLCTSRGMLFLEQLYATPPAHQSTEESTQ